MSDIDIDPRIEQILADFECPEEIPFGRVVAPVMVKSTWREGTWGSLALVPYEKIELEPTAKVLHYGQEIFEGMKAFKNNAGEVFLFRPQENAIRFDQSALRMAMPALAEGYFLTAVREITKRCRDFDSSEYGRFPLHTSLYVCFGGALGIGYEQDV